MIGWFKNFFYIGICIGYIGWVLLMNRLFIWGVGEIYEIYERRMWVMELCFCIGIVELELCLFG